MKTKIGGTKWVSTPITHHNLKFIAVEKGRAKNLIIRSEWNYGCYPRQQELWAPGYAISQELYNLTLNKVMGDPPPSFPKKKKKNRIVSFWLHNVPLKEMFLDFLVNHGMETYLGWIIIVAGSLNGRCQSWGSWRTERVLFWVGITTNTKIGILILVD